MLDWRVNLKALKIDSKGAKKKREQRKKEDATLKERHQSDKIKILNILHGNFFVE